MISWLIMLILMMVIYIAYRYYFKLKSNIKRYLTIFRSLGYKVYQQPFTFFGLSLVTDYQRGIKLHKDAQYFDRTIYPQVDIVIGNILDRVFINLVNPDLIKEFLTGNIIYKYPKLQMLVEGTKVAFGEGLVFSEGQQWKNKRKLLSKVFNFDLIKENIPKISEICDRCFDQYDQSHKIQGNKIKYDTLALSAHIFNGVIMKCFFGTDQVEGKIQGKKFEQFVVQTISDAAELTLSPLLVFFGKIAWKAGLTGPIRKSKVAIMQLRQKSAQILEKRTKEVLSSPKKEKPTDIIQALIYEKLQNKQQFSYSDKDLIDEFQTFLIAGTDTTTRFFTMLIYYLGKYPQIHEKVRKEINSVIKSDQDISYDNLKKLTYIDWVQAETTRMYGPANGIFSRMAIQDNFIKDIPISKETIVSIQPRGNHYSQKYFRNPNEFRPERWEKECEGIHPFALGGFSAGMRSCIGKSLAYLQSKIALIKLIRRYDNIEVPDQITMKVTFLFQAEHFQTVFTKSKPLN